METITVYIDIAPEFADLLSRQGIALERIILQTDHEAIITYGPLNFVGEEARSKDIVPIIIATSASLSAILLSLSSLLNVYFHRPHHYEWDELEELREDGKVVKDNDGNPVWKLKRQHQLISPQPLKGQQSVEFGAGIKGLVMRISSTKE